MADASLNQWRRQTALALSIVFGVLVVSCDERALPTQPAGGRSLVQQGAPGLTITRVEPNSGPTHNTFPLMIHGTGFKSGAAVTLGAHKAAVTSVTPTLITATAPSASQKNPVDVVVTNPGGERATLVGGFRYVPTPPQTVSGAVLGFTETGGWVPVPNLRLKVRAGPNSGAVGSTPLADTVTDARGSFTINDNSAFVLAFQTDPGSEYRFLCDWCPIGTTLSTWELYVVHRTWSGNRPPLGYFGWGTWAWGTVSEQIDGSLQPVADAIVTTLDTDFPATTNPNGFYMICSTAGAGQFRTITAFKSGYSPATSEAFDGGEVHFRLTRK